MRVAGDGGGAQAHLKDVIETLADLLQLRGVPAHIRSEQGPEFIAKALKDWVSAVGAQTAYSECGSIWGNG